MSILKTKKDLKEFKIWINALYSGEYKQTKRCLEKFDGFCCLGLACKLLIPTQKQHLNSEGYLFGELPIKQTMAPKWLIKIDGHFEIQTGFSLIKLNDIRNFSFEEIAMLLELVYIHKILE